MRQRIIRCGLNKPIVYALLKLLAIIGCSNKIMSTADKNTIQDLYFAYLKAWNNRDAKAIAALTTADCLIIGFDGSTMHSSAEVENTIGQIFKDHPTSAYVALIQDVRFLTEDIAILNSNAGMIPPGQNSIKPDVNAIQVLTAACQSGEWKIEIFQNTPAAFHGRPDVVKEFTNALQREFDKCGLIT